tara:strand:- start:42 stop:302 length:261 start_codon:yes stop_codon:yes gene_type:complete
MLEKSKYYYEYDRNKPHEDNIPKYYIGKNGMMAKDVCDQFDLPYHLATALTYIIRCKKKHNDKGVSDIKKAMAHLKFELSRIANYK